MPLLLLTIYLVIINTHLIMFGVLIFTEMESKFSRCKAIMPLEETPEVHSNCSLDCSHKTVFIEKKISENKWSLAPAAGNESHKSCE